MSDPNLLVPVTQVPEHRSLSLSDFDVRADSATDNLVIDGYASVFDHTYEVGDWFETVDRRAFDKTLAQDPDVLFLINHEGRPLARTKNGSMDLSADRKGLRVVARAKRSHPHVAEVEPLLRDGLMTEMSFAFRTIRQDYDVTNALRTLLEVNIHKGDVSVVNYGAAGEPASVQHVRSALALLGALDPEQALAEVRAHNNPADLIAQAQRSLDLIRRGVGPKRLSIAEAEALIATPR